MLQIIVAAFMATDALEKRKSVPEADTRRRTAEASAPSRPGRSGSLVDASVNTAAARFSVVSSIRTANKGEA